MKGQGQKGGVCRQKSQIAKKKVEKAHSITQDTNIKATHSCRWNISGTVMLATKVCPPWLGDVSDISSKFTNWPTSGPETCA